jgi:SAM-dependent methyltransferase
VERVRPDALRSSSIGLREDVLEVDREIAAGQYAKKQLLSPLRLISWSHGTRYRIGLELAASLVGKRVVDYGCGDGTFLALLCKGPTPPSLAVGAEIDEGLVSDCSRRLGTDPRLSFMMTSELEGAEHLGKYAGAVCMEVLEHATEPHKVLTLLHRLLEPGGILIASVPVETGPALLVKQTVRRMAGWFHIGDYPGNTPYRVGELLRSVFAGTRQHILRPVHGPPSHRFHDHKGFNWRFIQRLVYELFEPRAVLSSPIRVLPPGLGSQVWFVGRKRQES